MKWIPNRVRIGVLALAAGLLLWAFTTPSDRFFKIAKSLDTFAAVYRLANLNYVDEVGPTELINNAIEPMLSSLDPYTNYIPEDRIEDYRTMSTGEYGGIGAEVQRFDEKLIVTEPFEGYAADKAGLRVGDQILKINGVDISGRSLENIERLLKGQKNGMVDLTIKRPTVAKPMHLEVTYEKVKQKNVPYRGMVNEEVGLIKLTDFTQQAGREVEEALVYLKAQGAEKVILDLRGNPGGLLDEAVNICNVFLPRGLDIVKMRGRFDEWSNDYVSLNDPVDTEIPLAILIDNNSASASEIVSGVLQDYDRGVVIGQRSFGKGLVQTTTSLSYNSQLKVTVAKYYIPSGRCIQEVDYSHSIQNIGSSSRETFMTKGGRKVYDGAGIDPEIVTESLNLAPVTEGLIKERLIFDYAVRYRNQKDSIPPASEFSLSDAEYREFTKWVADKDFGYKTEVEQKLDMLVESAKYERYFEAMQEQIEQLKAEIARNKAADLQRSKVEIKRVLEHEIIKVRYLQTGDMQYSFQYNPDIVAALEVLNDPQKYRKLLGKDE